MPRRYPCPECEEPVVTFLRTGEAAACSACGAESEVPDDAKETEATPPDLNNPVVSRSPVGSRLSRSRPAHQWVLAGGLVALAGAVLSFLIGAYSAPSWEDVGMFLCMFISPIVFLAGAVLVGAGLVARGLDAIRTELAKGRKG